MELPVCSGPCCSLLSNQHQHNNPPLFGLVHPLHDITPVSFETKIQTSASITSNQVLVWASKELPLLVLYDQIQKTHSLHTLYWRKPPLFSSPKHPELFIGPAIWQDTEPSPQPSNSIFISESSRLPFLYLLRSTGDLLGISVDLAENLCKLEICIANCSIATCIGQDWFSHDDTYKPVAILTVSRDGHSISSYIEGNKVFQCKIPFSASITSIASSSAFWFSVSANDDTVFTCSLQ